MRPDSGGAEDIGFAEGEVAVEAVLVQAESGGVEGAGDGEDVGAAENSDGGGGSVVCGDLVPAVILA